MPQKQAREAVLRGPQGRPERPGLYNRPRKPSPATFRSFLQSLGGGGKRIPRSFGGWRNPVRCERAAADLLFLILDETAAPDSPCVASQILEGASRFGYTVQVDRVESRLQTGRDIFAIREITGMAFGTAGFGR